MIKRMLLAASALAVLAAPAAALADPGWGDHDGGEHSAWRGYDRDHRDHDGRGEWRGHEWREHGWRGYDRSEYRHGWNGWGGYGYASNCYQVRHGFYDRWGQYVDTPVEVCR